MTAAVDTSLATVNRLRLAATYTEFVKRSVVVAAAIALIRHHESGHGVSGDHIGRPSSVYGYLEASSRGYT